MTAIYYSPTYKLFVSADNQIFTQGGEPLRIREDYTDRAYVKYGNGLRVTIYSLNNDLVRVDGQEPFKRPFMNTRRRELMQKKEAIDYIFHLYNDMNMSIEDIAMAFGCKKDAISNKIDAYLNRRLYSEI
jgi:hypothetical protein